MKLFLIVIVTHMITSICVAQPKDSPHILYGLFSDSNPSQICYGSFDLDTLQFNNISSLSINDVGDPNRVKYSVLPLAYNPHNDVIYMAAPDNENNTTLSVINATNGELIAKSKSIHSPILSLQYDIFDKKLFASIFLEGLGNVTSIVGINTNDGSAGDILTFFDNLEATPISSYCPISKQFFLIMIDDQQYKCIIVNTSIDWPGNYSITGINFSPISMRFDYKTSRMYTTYIDQPDTFVSSLGILDTRTGGISKVVRTITYNSSRVVTSLSAYDTVQDIYYLSDQLTESNSNEISYVNVDTSEITSVSLPKNIVKAHGWFVKQFFAGKRKLI